MSKDDFLRECMRDVGTTAIDEFQRNVCVRCINRSCGRSSANNMLFNLRAQNWKRDLFDNVPRVKGDGSYSITGSHSKFISVNEPDCSIVATSSEEPLNETRVDDNNEGTKESFTNDLTETLPKTPAPGVVPVSNPGVYNTPSQSRYIQPPEPSMPSREVQEGNTITFDDE